MWTGALSALPSPVPSHPEGVRFTPGQADEVLVEPLGELTALQRRQLGDEADLVGAVLEAEATLTVGTVTFGAHA